MELGFLRMLDDDELQAALAHELGHVWIFTHHPYLQTERVANSIGERAVKRIYFEKLYSKLWTYERQPGVPFEQLLGPDPDAN
jgi:predicted Zn-dependent protease